PRCRFAQPNCRDTEPPLYQAGPGHWVACHYWEEIEQGKLRPHTPTAAEEPGAPSHGVAAAASSGALPLGQDGSANGAEPGPAPDRANCPPRRSRLNRRADP